MALTDDEKKEMQATMARGIADGLKLFRSEAEEEAAKNPPPEDPAPKKTRKPVSLWGFILGETS